MSKKTVIIVIVAVIILLVVSALIALHLTVWNAPVGRPQDKERIRSIPAEDRISVYESDTNRVSSSDIDDIVSKN